MRRTWMDHVLRLLDHRWAVTAVVALGAVVRIFVLLWVAPSPLVDDARDYHEMALALLQGKRFEPAWPPGVPYLLLPFLALFPHELTSRLVMLAVHGAFSVAVYVLALRASGRRAAVLALLVFGVAPSFVLASVTPLTQLPTATLMCLVAWLTLVVLDAPNSVGRAVGLGAALGCLVLLRPSNVVLCLGLLVWLAWRVPRAALASFLPVIFLVGAWSLQAHAMSGRWLFVNGANSQNFYYGNNPWTPVYRTWWFGSHKQGEPGVPAAFVEEHHRLARLPGAERDRAFLDAAVAHIQDRPALFVARTASRVRTFLAFDTFAGAQVVKKWHRPMLGLGVVALDGFLYLSVLVVALVRLFRGQRTKLELLLLGGAVLYALPYLVSFSHPTYHLPVVPLLAVIAGRTLEAGEGARLRSSTNGRLGLFVALALVALIQVEWALVSFSRLS